MAQNVVTIHLQSPHHSCFALIVIIAVQPQVYWQHPPVCIQMYANDDPHGMGSLM